MNRNVIIAIVVAVVVVIFVGVVFTSNNQAPNADGAATANSAAEQSALPAGKAGEPAETTGNNP
ncbi:MULTISPECIES: hypothetical protein [Devosia]|uniref:Uncharacterized protein n=2 Tax=Devosia TaxID=46913 RepID=A0A6M1SXC8_9HYPH|nr:MULTISPECIES: hypothetical protein [Devosia]NGP18953.1 hypothetical protein [Devosia aurantiaca]QQR40991.1 hypothetical protein JI748_08450 [Devosia rhizoryzae]